VVGCIGTAAFASTLRSRCPFYDLVRNPRYTQRLYYTFLLVGNILGPGPGAQFTF